MKKITAIAAILLASLAAAGSASAQDHRTKAKIPFGFYIENKWVPAGTYTLTSDQSNPEVIAIRSENSTVAVMEVGHAVDRKPGSNVLIFSKYGDKYFLHEILSASSNMNVEFNPSKREKQTRTEQASVAPATQVYLALK